MFLRRRGYATFEIVEKLELLFYINYLKKGMTVFDVGANIGECTLIFSKFVSESGVVHSFEPTPQTFGKLKSIISITGKKNVILNQVAVSKNEGKVNFNIYNEEHSTWNTYANRELEKYGIHIKPVECISVPTITIDSYCYQNNIKGIDLLKIDVEGAELDVFYGARQMFVEKKINCCVFEFGQTIHDMGRTSDEIKKFFSDVNYSVKNIVKNHKLYPVNKSSGIAQYAIHVAKPK